MAQDGVPPAPFSKTWHEQAMKRALRYAAENGYDGIGWTPGEVQAERYDLSKQIDNVKAKVSKMADGELGAELVITGKNGEALGATGHNHRTKWQTISEKNWRIKYLLTENGQEKTAGKPMPALTSKSAARA